MSTAYRAPLMQVDFSDNPEKIRLDINGWVSQKTHEKIQDLIPPGGIASSPSLVLVNCIYLKPDWAEKFKTENTKSRPFYAENNRETHVPTMVNTTVMGYSRERNYSVVAMPYTAPNLQFLIIVPTEKDGLQSVEGQLTGKTLSQFATVSIY